jgi:hypothetical protein
VPRAQRCLSGMRRARFPNPAEDKLHGTYGPLRFAGLEPSGNAIVPDEDIRLELAFINRTTVRRTR